VQTGRRQRDGRVPLGDTAAIDNFLASDDANGKARQVVLSGGIHSREFSSLTAEQCASTLFAGRRDSSDDSLRDVHVELRCREVVEEK
jgi:hypothetical protein